MKRTIMVLGASAVGLALAAPSLSANNNGPVLVPGDRGTTASNIVNYAVPLKVGVLCTDGEAALLARDGIVTDANVGSLWTGRLPELCGEDQLHRLEVMSE